MKTVALWMIMATLVLAGACYIGEVRPSASGMVLDLRPGGQVRTGELLAVPDSGIFFLYNNDRIVFTPFSAGTEVSGHRPWPSIRFTGRPNPRRLGQLRFHSRYPRGLDDDTLTRLMSMLDQRQAEVWP